MTKPMVRSIDYIAAALIALAPAGCATQIARNLPPLPPPPNCRSLSTQGEQFIAGRPDFHALMERRLFTVNRAGGTPRLLACTATTTSYRVQPMEHRCEALTQSSAELSVFAGSGRPAPVLAGGGAGAQQSYVFVANSHQRFFADASAVFRTQLSGPDCALAQGFVRAFEVGEWRTGIATSAFASAGVGPLSAGGGLQAQFFDGGTGPLTMEIGPISEAGQMQCPLGQKPAVENPAICVVDESSRSYHIRLFLDVQSGVCDLWTACDLQVQFQVPNGSWSTQDLSKGSNHEVYDVQYNYAARNLMEGITIRALDRDKFNAPEYLGECTARLSLQQIRDAAAGVPFQGGTACNKFTLRYTVTAM